MCFFQFNYISRTEGILWFLTSNNGYGRRIKEAHEAWCMAVCPSLSKAFTCNAKFVFFFVAAFDCNIFQIDEIGQEVIDGAALVIVEKEETETNIVGSEEMELNIAHIFEKIEHFTQMVVSFQFCFIFIPFLRIFCMKSHWWIPACKISPFFGRQLRKNQMYQGEEIIYIHQQCPFRWYLCLGTFVSY